VQPIFYCANDRETAFSETSKLTRENSDAPFDTLTTGEWEVQEDLTVCAIISNEEIHKLNEGMNSIKNDFQKMIERINSQEGVTEWWSVFELLAKQFMVSAKGDTSKYKISCAFASYAYEQTGKEWTPSSKNITESSLKSIDGILYASIINAEKGINLALKPSVVDDKKIKLLNAMRATMKKLNEANYIEDDIVICSSIDADNGLIHWE